MEKNLVSRYTVMGLFIVLVVTAANPNHRRRSDDTSNMQKQQRLFGRHQNERWMLPEEQNEELPEFLQPGKSEANQLKNIFMNDLPPHGPLMAMRDVEQHKLPTMPEDRYDDDYAWDGELDPTLPYGIPNVIPDPARLPRSKTRITRIKFQSLCPSKRETVFLNLDTEYEYRPDHYEEITCAHPFVGHLERAHSKTVSPVCGEAGFSCIQLNRTIFLTRRAYGADCWESETRLVSAGCECMWPKHFFGDISAHY